MSNGDLLSSETEKKFKFIKKDNKSEVGEVKKDKTDLFSIFESSSNYTNTATETNNSTSTTIKSSGFGFIKKQTEAPPKNDLESIFSNIQNTIPTSTSSINLTQQQLDIIDVTKSNNLIT